MQHDISPKTLWIFFRSFRFPGFFLSFLPTHYFIYCRPFTSFTTSEQFVFMWIRCSCVIQFYSLFCCVFFFLSKNICSLAKQSKLYWQNVHKSDISREAFKWDSNKSRLFSFSISFFSILSDSHEFVEEKLIKKMCFNSPLCKHFQWMHCKMWISQHWNAPRLSTNSNKCFMPKTCICYKFLDFFSSDVMNVVFDKIDIFIDISRKPECFRIFFIE